MKRIVLSAAAALAFALGTSAAEIPARIDIDTAVALALEHNYLIRQARAVHLEASAVLDQSRADRLPSVTAGAGYTRFEGGDGLGVSGPDRWSAGVQANQTLYSGGAVSSSIKASEASREAAVADFEAAVLEALLEVRERFYAVLLARERVEVQEQAVSLLAEELANATARVDAGSGSPFDRLRAEVALANGKPPLIRARNTLRLAGVDLFRVIGLPADEDAESRVDGDLSFVGGDPDLDALQLSARENRPELRRLEQLVASGEHLVSVARAGHRPQVGLFAAYDVQKSPLSDRFSDSDDQWSAGVQSSWNIFDGRATRARVAQAQARLEQTRLALRETTLAVETEVSRAYLSDREARELVTASQFVVTQATEAVRLARSRFDVGSATQLDVLQAQVALTEARTNEALALHDANVAFIRLRRAASLDGLPTGVSLQE